MKKMETYQDEDELFEEDVVFDHAGLLDSNASTKTAIRRISSGKCALFAKTLGLCGVFFGLGLCIAIPVPGVLDTPDHSMASSSYSGIYTIRSSGYLIGSFIGGVLFDRFNRLFLLFISLLLTSLFITIIPWCKILWLLRAAVVMLGILMGFLDTGCNVLCLDLWGRNSGPFMQALHFSFSLGVFIAPMLSAPFMEVIQLNVSSEVNSSFLQNLHISNPHDEKLFKRMFDDNDYKGQIIRVDRDTIFQNESAFSNETDFGKVWNSGSNISESIHMSSNTEIPKHSLLIKSQSNLSEINYFNSNDSANTSIEDVGNELESSTEYVNTTQKPSMHTTPRVPKPKPSFTDAGKLDHTKDWDKIRVGKPPPEDLIAPSTKTLPEITTSLSVTSQSSISLNSSVVTTPANVHKESNCSEIEQLSDTIPALNNSETSEPPKILKNDSLTENKINNTSEGRVNVQIAQTGNNESYLGHKSVFQEYQSSRKNFSSDIPQILNSTVIVYSHQSKGTNDYSNNSQGSLSSLNLNGSTLSPIPHMATLKNIQENPVWSDEETSSQGKNTTSVDKISSVAVDKVIETSLQSGYKNSSSNREKNKVEDQEWDDSGHSTQKVWTPVMVTNPPMNVVHITVHELDKMFQGDEYTFGNNHENSPSNNRKKNEEDESTFSNIYTSEIPPKHKHHSKPGTYDNDTEDISTIFDVFANRIEKYGFSKIQFTYLIVGLFVFSISLLFLGFLCHNPRDPKSKQEDGVGQYKITSKFLLGFFVSCMSLFFSLSVGLEMTFGHNLLNFAVNSDLSLPRSTGNCLTFLFWGSFAAMRFASIFCASGFSPTSMLIFNFFMCSLGSIILSTLSNEVETALWLGTSFLGIGLASMFPTGILWVERYIHVSNKVAAFFIMGVSLGEITLPLIVKYLMQSNQLMLMYAAAVTTALCICTYTVLWCLVSHYGEKYVYVGNNGYQLASQHDEEEDMVELSPSNSSTGLRTHGPTNELGLLLNGHSSFGH